MWNGGGGRTDLETSQAVRGPLGAGRGRSRFLGWEGCGLSYLELRFQLPHYEAMEPHHNSQRFVTDGPGRQLGLPKPLDSTLLWCKVTGLRSSVTEVASGWTAPGTDGRVKRGYEKARLLTMSHSSHRSTGQDRRPLSMPGKRLE